MICLWMWKTYTAKTSPGDFKVTIPQNPLLSQQAITSKESQYLILTYSWTLTPIPNWTCSVVKTFLLIHGSLYVNNQFDSRIPVRGLLTNLRKMLATKFFSSSHDEDHKTLWLQNPTVYKHSNFLKRKMN